MSLPSFFARFRPGARQGLPSAPALSAADIEAARLRARRRMIGMAVLVGAGVIGFPWLFETQPRPMPGDLRVVVGAPLPGAAVPSAPGSGLSPADMAPEGMAADEPAPDATERRDAAVAQGPAPSSAPPMSSMPPATAAGAGSEAAGMQSEQPDAASEARVASAGPASDVMAASRPSDSENAAAAAAAAAKAAQAAAIKARQEALAKARAKEQAQALAQAEARKKAQAQAQALAKAKAAAASKPEPKVAEAKAKPPATKPPAAKSADTKAADTKAAPNGADGVRYIVQVGAFGDANTAHAARMKVERLGIRTYTQQVDGPGGKKIRVRVGPFQNKAEADKAMATLRKAGLVAGLLTL